MSSAFGLACSSTSGTVSTVSRTSARKLSSRSVNSLASMPTPISLSLGTVSKGPDIQPSKQADLQSNESKQEAGANTKAYRPCHASGLFCSDYRINTNLVSHLLKQGVTCRRQFLQIPAIAESVTLVVLCDIDEKQEVN